MKAVAFRYQKRDAFLYHVPAIIKLILLFPLAISVMYLNLICLCAGFFIIITFGFFSGFSIKDQWANIKPALIYGFLLYQLTIAGRCIDILRTSLLSFAVFPSLLIPGTGYVLLVLRLTLVMLLSSLLFCTTSSIEIKDAVCMVEIKIRSLLGKIPFIKISPHAEFGLMLALSFNFIPHIVELWDSLERSYTARGGKKGFRKIRILLFPLLSLSFYAASEKAKALAARGLAHSGQD